MEGKVKKFNPEKGFGFITMADGKDVFVHHSQIMMKGFRTLEEGQKVKFDLVNTDKGLQANKVKVVESK